MIIHENFITFTWSQVERDRVDYYLIDLSYQDVCNNSMLPQTVNSHQVENRTIHFNDLEEFSSYFVSVTAVNSEGNDSSNFSITTLSSG